MSEHESRLRAMLDPKQQTWDLSPNDITAIRWAVERITALTAAGDAMAKIMEQVDDDCEPWQCVKAWRVVAHPEQQEPRT